MVPRQFLREFVGQMDLVNDHDDYVPMTEYGFDPGAKELQPEEQFVVAAVPMPSADDDDGDIATPQEDVW